MNRVAIDEEYVYEGNVNISQTDINGVITYVNLMFGTISGYTSDQVIGQNHNIIRHPDMPKGAFAKMWESISGGQSWNGLVKNLRADGYYYWVDLEILPIKDDQDRITGYISVGKPASKKDIKENTELYLKMLEAEV